MRDSARLPEVASAELCARRMRRGEPAAVQQVRRRVERILAYQGLRIGPEDRDDLRQEIMTQLWQAVNRPGFDPTAGFWGFVEMVTSRRAIDWLRRHGRRPEETPLDGVLEEGAESVAGLAAAGSAPDPDGQVLHRERLRLAAEALAGLAEPCRRLLVLVLRDGHSYRELAKTFGKSEGALRVQVHRCIRRARAALDDIDGATDLTETAG